MKREIWDIPDRLGVGVGKYPRFTYTVRKGYSNIIFVLCDSALGPSWYSNLGQFRQTEGACQEKLTHQKFVALRV